MDAHVDTADLLAQLAIPIPTVVTPQMFTYQLLDWARSDRKHIVLPEGEDDRILTAAGRLLQRGVAELTILGEEAQIRARAAELGVDLSAAAVLNPQTSELCDKFAEQYAELRKHKGVTVEQAREIIHDVSYFGTMLVHNDMVDGMVSGARHTTAHTVRPSFEIIKTLPDVSTVSSIFLMCLADRVLAYGDCAIVPDPTSEQLADIAISSARTAAQVRHRPAGGDAVVFDRDQRVPAPTSTRSGRQRNWCANESRTCSSTARSNTTRRSSRPWPRRRCPTRRSPGRATVLIFPDLNTGNNTYKAVQRSAGAIAIGPVLQGLKKPVNDLSRGALVEDIVNTVAITAIQAQTPMTSRTRSGAQLRVLVGEIRCGRSGFGCVRLADGIVERIGERSEPRSRPRGGACEVGVRRAGRPTWPGWSRSGIGWCTAARTCTGRRSSTTRWSRKLEELAPLAPLHNPPAVLGIEVARKALPDLPHVAVFDTAFFHDLPPAAATYAIDRDIAERWHIRRYGFHGTSHQYVSEQAAAFLDGPLDRAEPDRAAPGQRRVGIGDRRRPPGGHLDGLDADGGPGDGHPLRRHRPRRASRTCGARRE